MKKLNTELVFPLAILVMSVLELGSVFFEFRIFTIIISLIGITSTLMYFMKIRYFRHLMYIWIISQIIVIDREILNYETNTWHESPIWNVTQFFGFPLGFTMEYKSSKIMFGVNILACFFFGFLKILEVSSLIGKKFVFEKFGSNNKLGNIFPLFGTAIKRVKVSGKKDYLLVQLDFPFTFHDREVSYVLIKDKNAGLIIPGKKQLVYFKIVKNIEDVTDEDNDGRKFPFIDWAYCQ